jgi:isoleucyl-tRNA synthetase
VAFSVDEPSEALASFHSTEDPLKVAIWTTTPWTMPANMAVAVNPDLDYSVVQHPKTGKLLVATDLAAGLAKKFDLPEGEQLEVLKDFKGEDLVGTTYTHPLYDRKAPVIAGGDYITTESGTGLVHTAPGHGQEDYQTGLKYGLDLVSPVDDVGKFTIEAGERFVGLSVLAEGNIAMIDALAETGALLKVEDYGHKYPYDWRTKKPTIFRATDQWFASVAGFRDATMKAIDTVRSKFVPRLACFFLANDEFFYPEGLSAFFAIADIVESFLHRRMFTAKRVCSFLGPFHEYSLCS